MPEITAAVAAVCALMLVAMSADVAYQRSHHKVALQGLGENKHVTRAVRAHGNYTEHVPLALVLLLLLELRGTPPAMLVIAGSLLVVARLSHWFGLKTSSGPTPWRLFGVGVTWLVLAGEAVGLLVSLLG